MSEADRVIVTRPILGICHMQVCAVADATDEEILAVCNRLNPAGTQLGWTTVIRSDEPEGWKPVACESTPGRLHILVAC